VDKNDNKGTLSFLRNDENTLAKLHCAPEHYNSMDSLVYQMTGYDEKPKNVIYKTLKCRSAQSVTLT